MQIIFLYHANKQYLEIKVTFHLNVTNELKAL